MHKNTQYSIREVAQSSGLPASTLRYYESIGIIRPIHRDASSKQRVYTQDDVDMIDALSCLSATGMSIDDMRSYLVHSKRGKAAAQDEVALLRAQAGRLEAESQYLELRKRYVALKIQYWQALEAGDESRVETIRGHARQLAQELKFPKE